MIAKKSLFILISQVISRFVGWVGLVILANLWGGYAPEALGIIGFAIAFFGLYSLITDLGFNAAHIKRISEGKDKGLCIGTFATVKVILVCVMTVCVLISIFFMKFVLKQGFYDATTESAIYIFLVYYIFISLSQIPVCTFEGTKEIVKRQIITMSEIFVKVPLLIIVVLAGVKIGDYVDISPIGKWPVFLESIQQFISVHAIGSLSMAYAFGAIGCFLVGFWFLRRYKIKRPDRATFKSYFVFALPFMIFSTIFTLNQNIDKVMIGYFWTATDVGYYYASQQIIQVLLIFSFAVGVVLFPTISNYHASEKYEKLREVTLLAERYISMVTLPVIVVVIVFHNALISIMFSAAFLPASSVLIILVINSFFTDLSMPYSSLISGIDKPKLTAKIGISMCILNIILNILFIPQYGVLSPFGINGAAGAAMATLISGIFGLILLRINAKKLINMPVFQSHTIRHIIAAIITGLILYFFILPITSNIRWYHMLIYSGIGLGVYLVVLYLLREFKKEDYRFFINLINIKGLFKLFKDELYR